MTPDPGPSSIQVLDALEAVRRRPAMYFGDTGSMGLHHLVWEVIANSIDQHLAREATHLRVDVDDEGWITIEGDGPGIPTAPLRDGPRVLEDIFLRLHHGPSRFDHFPHVHVAPSMHGVGLAAVSAVCARLEVESRHRGEHWRAAFERGVMVEPARSIGPSERSGTRIRMLPDAQIFSNARVDHALVEERLRELAWLCPLLAIRWQGTTLPGRGGPAGWVREIAGDALLAGTLLSTTRDVDDVQVDLALGWTDRDETTVRSFVNFGATQRGTHVRGVYAALVAMARAVGSDADARVVHELLLPGLVVVVHVGLFDASFGSPTRDHLVTPLAEVATRTAIERALRVVLAPRSALATFLRGRLGVGDAMT
ncbi:ATP-binding protein [Sandaracinus amylolyticus]|uniref:ATP-binding protein n=1 Tax=Sandaracinus amylolyticus TaxID=927083 RepID=UPI001F486C5A|nr:ATP-binding protein [Sandaracinus amylolyticus]UJR84088.1 Hypothetical protein I5071_61590 [Sandaracinus amylolyticus]